MNIGQLTSLVHCVCGASIEICPNMESIECINCGTIKSLIMRDLTEYEERACSAELDSLSTPTGIRLFED